MSNDTDQEYKAGFVAVVGRPNVGKSTLINALLGQKVAAVSPRPQTTRRQQLGILTLDGAQIIFTDTPGVHRPHHKLGNLMNDEALQSLESPDAILFLVDASVPPHEEDRSLADTLKELKSPPPIISVLNKIDNTSPAQLAKNLKQYDDMLPKSETIKISALKDKKFDALIDLVLARLPNNPPFFPDEQVTDLFERDIAADLIREAALNLLREEVPHAMAVRIDEFTERGDKGAYIQATLFIERESQKGIVIGKGGAMLKQIGTAARKEIEAMSGRKVFLKLRVKQRKNWRNDASFLQHFNFRKRNQK